MKSRDKRLFVEFNPNLSLRAIAWQSIHRIFQLAKFAAWRVEIATLSLKDGHLNAQIFYICSMQSLIHENQVFEDISYVETTVKGQEFSDCVFKKCDFSNSEFLNNKFIDCVFEHCNLTMMKLDGTTLNNAVFKNCKILGVNFTRCQDFLFSVRFENCTLDYSSFMEKKMLKTNFIKTSLKEVTFTRANLAGSIFDDCNLMEAVFNGTDLSSVNFASSYNYILDPELNTMKKAVFSINGVAGLLTKYGIKIV